MFSIYSQMQESGTRNRLYLLIATIGAMSYSIFIWHQVFIAFYKYSINSSMDIVDYMVLILITAIVSIVSYRLIEKPLGKYKGKYVNRVLLCSIGGALLVGLSGLYIYANAGVVRNVPELGVCKTNAQRGMHGAYCDRIYGYERPFEDDGKIKVLGIGNSFVRDWLNILLESDYADSLDISYVYTGHINENNAAELCERIDSAAVVFFNCNISRMPASVSEILSASPEAYYVGTKSFGESNGIVYRKRNTNGYFNTKIKMIPEVEAAYKTEIERWGDKYVDMIAPLIDADGYMPVFSDDSMFISQDCRHLTQAGAKYYARKIDLAKYLINSSHNNLKQD